MKFSASLIVLIAIASSAFASDQAAQTCADGLDSNAKLIYANALPQAQQGVDLKSVVTAATKALVLNGQVARANAKTAAVAAGECLKLKQQ